MRRSAVSWRCPTMLQLQSCNLAAWQILWLSWWLSAFESPERWYKYMYRICDMSWIIHYTYIGFLHYIYITNSIAGPVSISWKASFLDDSTVSPIGMNFYGFLFGPQRVFPLDDNTPWIVVPLLGSYCICVVYMTQLLDAEWEDLLAEFVWLGRSLFSPNWADGTIRRCNAAFGRKFECRRSMLCTTLWGLPRGERR